ncbi:MAG TPA: arginine--tRNA ligase [Candidatus Limnocylindrales bacterium]|nr:arginine--tRNA ligase [Candidatus Limnocylindrales bacterium]
MPPTAEPTTTEIPLPLRTQVRLAIERAWGQAVAAGMLPVIADDAASPEVEIERPAQPEHGDLATSLALKLARPYRQSPMAIASAIAAELRTATAEDPAGTPITDADVAAPGFLNLRLAEPALAATVDAVLRNPSAWGRVEAIRPRSVNVEFVSANPTGPLTVGNARGAFVGDLLCRVLEAGGQRVTREYYFNDAGAQIAKLGASVVALKRGEPVPEDGYHGGYVGDLAADLPDDEWTAATAPGVDAADAVGRWAARRVRAAIESSLTRLGVRFDVWKSEGSLHSEGWVERAVARLREHGHVYEQDGAVWFRSTTFGDDKDRVIIRSNGEPTYFAADIGYVTEKLSRGFDHLIYIWGADHHGTVARLRNAAEAMGYDKEAVQVLLYSWVRFVRDGVEVSMSKRAGDFITLDELLSEVGVDAARWFFASRGPTTGIDFDIELAKKQSNENPVYYVQYAHARIASIVRKATETGLRPATTVRGSLSGAPEAALARAIVRFPEVVEDAVLAEETHGITAYATEVATTFHGFYRDARVVDAEEPDRSAARLALAKATQTTLANALGLLGISAPDSM